MKIEKEVEAKATNKAEKDIKVAKKAKKVAFKIKVD